MRSSIAPFVLLIAAFIAVPAADSRAGDRAIGELVEITATVEGVNLARREVKLKGPSGVPRVFKVGPRVQKLDNVAVGDVVRMEYFHALATDIREPTAEEWSNPVRILEARTEDGAPAGMKMIHAVVTIEEIDRDGHNVTVRGPLGGTRTIPVADPAQLDTAKIGDTVIVTYTEAMAVSLEKL